MQANAAPVKDKDEIFNLKLWNANKTEIANFSYNDLFRGQMTYSAKWGSERFAMQFS